MYCACKRAVKNSATTPFFRNPSIYSIIRVRIGTPPTNLACKHSIIVGGVNDLRREAFSSYGTSPRHLQVLLSSTSYFSECWL